MTADEFVPAGFDPPTSLTTDQFHLEPLGPQVVRTVDEITGKPCLFGDLPQPVGIRAGP